MDHCLPVRGASGDPMGERSTEVLIDKHQSDAFTDDHVRLQMLQNTSCSLYEKLEYLGDAVLDYLVTSYIYSQTTASSGKMTDIRPALVNNNMLASIIVKNKLHPWNMEKFGKFFIHLQSRYE